MSDVRRLLEINIPTPNKMRDYKKLLVWEKAHNLNKQVYDMSKSLPSEERFNLISQLRRASLSVPTNIVEGSGRETNKEFARFLSIAAGSISEVEYLTFFAFEVQMINREVYESVSRNCTEIRKMLYHLIRKNKV